ERFENTAATVDRSKSATAIYARRRDLHHPSEAVSFIQEMGLNYKRATEKQIPDAVFRLNEDQITRLIGAMWSGDGCCNVGGKGTRALYYATSSPQLADDLSHLLLRLGIRTTVSTKGFRYRGDIRPGWQIHVITEEGQRRFGALIGPHLVGRRAADMKVLLASFPPPSTFRSTVDQIGANDVRPIIRREAKRAAAARGSSIEELCRQGGFSSRLVTGVDPRKKGYRRDTLRLMAEAFESNVLADLADADVWWD